MNENHPPSNESAGRVPIERNRRLISAWAEDATNLTEYFDRAKQARVIAIPSDSEVLAQHQLLERNRLPLFPSQYDETGACLLLVPSDTRTIKQALKFIALDIRTYGGIFYQLGETLRRARDAELGVLSGSLERSILDSLAFSLDDSVIYGGSIHLVPPYQLDRTTGFEHELSALSAELNESTYLEPDTSQRLLEMTRLGYEAQ